MWSDKEAHLDCLGYTTYVNVLANICTHRDLAPLTLGIFGPWGSGKTSLMHMLRSHIDATKGDKKRKTLWFNAWMYEGREEAQSALIHALLRLFQDDVTLVGEAKELWGKLKKGASVLKLGKAIGTTLISMTPNIGDYVDAFEEESGRIADTMESFEGDLTRLMKLVQVDRIVVFIDDLDRCSSKKVIETFETIKLFLNTPTCTFVIGADAEKIKDAVGDVYGATTTKQRQKDYLEKIVQIPFGIPAQDKRDIGCYIGMLVVGRHLNDAAWTQLSNARKHFYESNDLNQAFADWVTEQRVAFSTGTNPVTKELDAVLPYIDVLSHGLRGNPRQIKRFLNILSLRQQLGVANNLKTEPDLLVKCTVLEYVWDEFFTDLATNVNTKTGQSELLAKLVAIKDGTEIDQADGLLDKYYNKAPGLVEFLKSAPRIDGETKLQPYLFLAQTSLGQSQSVAMVTVDEATKALVASIEGTDPIPAKAAAIKAANDAVLASAVFRHVLSDLAKAKDPNAIVNMVTGLATIGRKNTELFKSAYGTVEKLDHSNPAINLVVNNFITDATTAGAAPSMDLISKFKSKSKIVEALSKPRSAGRSTN